jgi:hypothetical protein
MVVVNTRELWEGSACEVKIESSRFEEGWYNRLDLETSVDSRLEASLVFDDNILNKVLERYMQLSR